MSLGTRIQTSKWLLALVILGGLTALLTGIDPTRHQLAGFGLVLVAAIYNRLDSRRRGYEVSLSLGRAKAVIKTGESRESACEDRGGPGRNQGEVRDGDDGQ